MSSSDLGGFRRSCSAACLIWSDSLGILSASSPHLFVGRNGSSQAGASAAGPVFFSFRNFSVDRCLFCRRGSLDSPPKYLGSLVTPISYLPFFGSIQDRLTKGKCRKINPPCIALLTGSWPVVPILVRLWRIIRFHLFYHTLGRFAGEILPRFCLTYSNGKLCCCPGKG